MIDTRSYEARIEDLFSRHASVASAGFSSESYKPGLDAQRRLDLATGSPSRAFRSIHVAGTNGKGSVCSFLASALASAGFRVGLYTSPHLVDFRERIKIISLEGDDTQARLSCDERKACFRDGRPVSQGTQSSDVPESVFSCEMISREGVVEFLDRFESDLEGLTFFEVTTGMAFWWFAHRRVDFAVIETGLGGRLDSTNIIVPEVSVVTSIGLDHCALLGDTRAAIAGEKAGIFKSGVPAVVGLRDSETAPVFEARASELGCPLYYAEDFPFSVCETSGREDDSRHPEASQSREYTAYDFRDYNLDLKGPCQDINLRTALSTLSLLKDSPIFFESAGSPRTCQSDRSCKPGSHMTSSGSCSDEPAVNSGKPRAFCRRALENAACVTGFHGRWEYVLENVICDIGHNPPALKENFARLEALGRPMIIVYGIMADKDLDGIAPLMPSGARYILTAPATLRALPARDLFDRLSVLRPDLDLTLVPDVPSAVRMARAIATSGITASRGTSDSGNVSASGLASVPAPSCSQVPAQDSGDTSAQSAAPSPVIYVGGSTYVVSEAVKALK